MDLAGRAVLITGGRRIGAVIAQTLAERGMDVALSYNRSRVEADATAASVTAAGRRAHVAYRRSSRSLRNAVRSSTALPRHSGGSTC